MFSSSQNNSCSHIRWQLAQRVSKSPSEKDYLEMTTSVVPWQPHVSEPKVGNSSPEQKPERPKEYLRHSQHLLPTIKNGGTKWREHLLVDCAAPRYAIKKNVCIQKQTLGDNERLLQSKQRGLLHWHSVGVYWDWQAKAKADITVESLGDFTHQPSNAVTYWVSETRTVLSPKASKWTQSYGDSWLHPHGSLSLLESLCTGYQGLHLATIVNANGTMLASYFQQQREPGSRRSYITWSRCGWWTKMAAKARSRCIQWHQAC